VSAGHDVELVVSRADTRRGRGPARSPSPVAAAAHRLRLPVSDQLDDVLDTGAELGVVVAYGRIVPARLLEAMPMVNLHFSLLPRWRGAAPVERAILAGDAHTGVCVMRLEAGLDTGPVLARRRVELDDAHASSVTEHLAALGAAMLVELLAAGAAGLGPGEPQVGEPTYAAKLDPAELRLDWRAPAVELQRVVRLDRAWTTFRGKRLRVLDSVVRAEQPLSAEAPGTLAGTTVRAGAGALELRTVQPEGRSPMTAEAWCRGVRPRRGEQLGAGADPEPGTGTDSAEPPAPGPGTDGTRR
jgi:methionyl-tRNA formyltransferase